MKRQLSHFKVHSEDLRVAKGIAAFKGMTLIEYFGSVVDKEAKDFKMEMNNPFPVYRRRKE